MKRLVSGLLFILTFSCVTFAQKVYTPEKGSTERTAILDVLRVPVEKELKQKVQFSVGTFNVQGNWAFLSGVPQNSSGSEPDYSKTKYNESIDAGMFDNNFQSLLKKTGGKWKVVTFEIGCTDVCYATWWKDYKAPKAIFPYSE